MPKEFAKRFPTDTALEVYTPTNPPPSPVESMAHADLSDMPDTGGTNYDHDARYLRVELDPLSLHLDQTTPQTMTGLADGALGLISGVFGIIGRNIDGGFSNSVYLTSQNINGGGA